MVTVVLLGTLDTKGDEYAFVRERLRAAGVGVVTVDTGVLGAPGFPPDVAREEVAAAAGTTVGELAAAGDRGRAVTAMAAGARTVVERLHREGRVDGGLALGGTGGTSIAAHALRVLPLGVPKVVVSTAASGDTSAYVGESDLVLMPSVVDVAGINRISAAVLAHAAAAVAGMVTAAPPRLDADPRPLVAASMFGVTTPCVTAARERLEELGYEVLVFHMTGTGGRTLESLVEQGYLAGVLDVTTTELADDLVGGVFSAGAQRLTAAAAAGVPQVVSVGALDMVNFGPRDTVPAEFADRNLYVHNPTVTLMRTTPEECAELGTRLAERVAAATGPAAVFLPLGGVSGIAIAGGPFHDPAADTALFDAVRAGLLRSPSGRAGRADQAGSQVDAPRVALREYAQDINDPVFAVAMADELHALISGHARTSRKDDA